MKSKGYTLVELLTVIAIIGLLMAITIPLVLKIVDSASKSAFENDIKTIVETVQLEYETLSTGNYPCVEGSAACLSSSDYKVLPRYNFGIDRKNNALQTTSIFGVLHIKGDLPSGGSVFYKSLNNDLEAGYYKKYDKEEEDKLSVVVSKLISKNGKWCADKEYGSNKIVIKKTSEDSGCIQHLIVDGREIGLKASEIAYDNSKTKINCTDAQCALDKIAKMIE
ncbi:MAG: prepilin-type N-terminal cleavage/methylation domain-containing protein [Bacilli bacterium]|nr:prepilin-type N-terminal cleavage/methylation domain-containing protein [Bacilli bacterium]